jgi:hypothetical protein
MRAIGVVGDSASDQIPASHRDLVEQAWGADPQSLTSFEPDLLLDGAFGQGLGFQAIVGDPCTTFNGEAEGALRDASFGTDHGCKLGLQVRDQRLVGHVVLDLGTSVVRLAGLVEVGRILGLLVAGQLGECCLDPTAFACHERSRSVLIHDALLVSHLNRPSASRSSVDGGGLTFEDDSRELDS